MYEPTAELVLDRLEAELRFDAICPPRYQRVYSVEEILGLIETARARLRNEARERDEEAQLLDRAKQPDFDMSPYEVGVEDDEDIDLKKSLVMVASPALDAEIGKHISRGADIEDMLFVSHCEDSGKVWYLHTNYGPLKVYEGAERGIKSSYLVDIKAFAKAFGDKLDYSAVAMIINGHDPHSSCWTKMEEGNQNDS